MANSLSGVVQKEVCHMALASSMEDDWEAVIIIQQKSGYSGYRKARDEMKELLTVKANVDRIMG